jgi:hypothetical protein
MRYYVQIEIDTNEWFYATGKDAFTLNDPPILFDTQEEAQMEADKWNTGTVQEWHIDRKKGISKEIRHMTEEERQRAKEREEANKCTQSSLKKTPQ